MSKSKNKSFSKSPSSGPSTYTKNKRQKQSQGLDQNNPSQASGLEEIDTLFASKRESSKLAKKEIQQQVQADKLERQRRKEARSEEEADKLALRGPSSHRGGSKRSADASAPQSLHARACKLKTLTYTRSDLTQLDNDDKGEQKQKWASDGLGGIFNVEGYTGRRDEGGHRVFKAHLMNKEGFGMSKDCPFDCDCCYI